MEENSRINRRSRPRPYDLRRKVLLKNFLREQMTYIPGSKNELASPNDVANDISDPSISLSLDEDLTEMNDENTTSSMNIDSEQSSTDSSASVATSSINTESKGDVENVNDSVLNSSDTCTDSQESSLFKISNLIKIKRDSKKKQKGIVKAKEVRNSVKSPQKTRSFKAGLERVFSRSKKPSDSLTQNPKHRNPPRSLFTLFKSRRAQRNANEVDVNKRSRSDRKSFSSGPKYRPVNQSVQTEESWISEEMHKNKLLRESNIFLTERLSYFMSNSSRDSQIHHRTSPLQMSNKVMLYDDYNHPSSSYASGNWNPRSRVVRSKSVQEQNERRHSLRNNYRTRSMSSHSVRNKFLLPDPKPPVPSYYPEPEAYSAPRLRRKTILANLPVNSGVRGIQRRSSMPERILSENDRSIACRRSETFRHSTYNRKPFHSLPSEAFF